MTNFDQTSQPDDNSRANCERCGGRFDVGDMEEFNVRGKGISEEALFCKDCIGVVRAEYEGTDTEQARGAWRGAIGAIPWKPGEPTGAEEIRAARDVELSDWEQGFERRKAELIEKKISKTASASELAELERLKFLTEALGEYSAPLPMQQLRKVREDMIKDGTWVEDLTPLEKLSICCASLVFQSTHWWLLTTRDAVQSTGPDLAALVDSAYADFCKNAKIKPKLKPMPEMPCHDCGKLVMWSETGLCQDCQKRRNANCVGIDGK